MNLKENLLVTVSEECAEVQQAVSKMLRFGYSSENTNAIMYEFYQLCAMIEMCQAENILPELSDKEQAEIMENKKEKVRHYQNISRTRGTLEEVTG